MPEWQIPQTKRMYLRRPFEERFWERVEKSDTCWLRRDWYTAHGDGYSRISHGGRHGKIELAHRVAWTLATGEALDPGAAVCHTCDVPACVRNDDEGTYELDGMLYRRRGHLFLGNVPINNRDLLLKGHTTRGERSPFAKLTDATVREMRQRRTDEGVTISRLAHEYGVSQGVVCDILNRKRWRHV